MRTASHASLVGARTPQDAARPRQRWTMSRAGYTWMGPERPAPGLEERAFAQSILAQA